MYSLLLCVVLAAARPFTPEELLHTRRADDVRVSPDGNWASVTVRQKDLDQNRDVKDIWLLPLHGGEARQFTRNGMSEHARWSPDGKQLLVVKDGQLWLYGLDGGDGQKLTSLSTGADGGIFSPDGRTIAFTSDVYPQCTEPAGSPRAASAEEPASPATGGARTRAASAEEPASPATGGARTRAATEDTCNKGVAEERAKGSKARVVNHLFARHWTEWKEGKRTHLFVMPIDGTPRDVTPGDQDWPAFSIGGADDYAFTNDGGLIVHTKLAAHEAWSTNGDLYLLTPRQQPVNLTSQNTGDDAQPRPSPDGRLLAWTAQRRDGYESDLWKLRLQDVQGSRRIVDVDVNSNDAGAIVWRRDSKGLVVSVVENARFYLESVTPDGRHQRFSPAPVGADFDLAPDGSAVVVIAGITHPPEVFTVAPGGQPQRLSHFNDQQYAGLDLGTIEELWVKGKDGARVHSWIARPAGNPRAPLLVLVHGGPQGSWEDAWSMRWNIAAFAARGYVVLTTDFHGSTGYGQKFKEEISGDWGGLAYDDIQRATDAALKLPNVAGIGCAAGASFGGYMIDWIAGHTDRFKCLVSHDGVFDLVSEYGSTEELWFPEWEFRGPYWQNPDLYEKFSPSRYVKDFRTPTLVVQGELDYRVPVEQGLGMFTALQRRGIESRLLYFPDEGHWVLKPRNSQVWYHTVLDWIDAHAKPRLAGGSGSK
jgi:dipeptidyl aminopeptidase/acylaminoacyl peptidase